jgi:periplasmic copper chaperone A
MLAHCARRIIREEEMGRRGLLWLSAFVAMLTATSSAMAHVGFLQRQVPIGGVIESTLRVPHGCNGSPTLRLRVRLPLVVTAVRPRPKDGWTVAVTGEGARRELTWTGRLPDKQTGDFPFAMDLDPSAKAGDVIYFPVVQECEKGVARWIDLKGRPLADAPETDEHDESTSPAPSIRLLPRR